MWFRCRISVVHPLEEPSFNARSIRKAVIQERDLGRSTNTAMIAPAWLLSCASGQSFQGLFSQPLVMQKLAVKAVEFAARPYPPAEQCLRRWYARSPIHRSIYVPSRLPLLLRRNLPLPSP